MTKRMAYRARAARLWRDEGGATLIEFAIVLSLFLLVFFGFIDFGRLSYHLVTTERAMHAAARISAVRPAACPGLPDFIVRNPLSDDPVVYGSNCAAGGGNICADPGVITCAGSEANPTAAEVWAIVQTTAPAGTDIANLRFTYAYDRRLVFLGGPYVPVVTVELEDVTFAFVTPLSALAALASGTPDDGAIGGEIAFPGMSVSMPSEDLAHGENG